MSRKSKQPDEWLDTLLPARQFPQTPLIAGGGTVTTSESVLEIPLDSLDANPYQTRTVLDEASLGELADSIKSIGLMEPIVVRSSGSGRYQVIAGERRVKACYMAGVYKIPAVVRNVSDQQAAAMTIIENLLREDVNPIDQAQGFRHLAGEFGFSREQIAERTGKSRAAICNFLRLLRLPPRVQEMLRRGKLSLGHGKALLELSKFEDSLVVEYAQKIAPLSVRKAEELIAGFLGTPGSDPTLISGRYLRPKLCIAERQLGKSLATPVAIIESRGKGHIRVPFADLYEFERLYTFLTGDKMELAYPPRSEKAG
jgi:ParB family transcriptional regulator, chromosome partitioning protein